AALGVRRSAREAFGYAAALGLGLLVVLGLFRHPDAFGPEHAVVWAAWAVVLGARLHTRLRERREAVAETEQTAHTSAGRAQRRWLDWEIALLLLVAAHAVLQMFGGLDGPYYPFMYAL